MALSLSFPIRGLGICLQTRIGLAVLLICCLFASLRCSNVFADPLQSADGVIDRRVVNTTKGQQIILTCDVGSIATASSKAFKVRFHNESMKPKKLVFSSASCGCLAITNLPNVIAPGESEEISLRISTEGKRGKLDEFAILKASDDDRFHLTISVVGVVAGIWSEPDSVHLGSIQPGHTSNRRVRVFAAGHKPNPKLISIQADTASLVVRRQSEVLDEQDRRDDIELLASVNVEMAANGAAMGDFQSTLKVVTNDATNPVLTIPITAHLLGQAKLRPPLFNFGLVTVDSHPTRQVELLTKDSVPENQQLTFRADHPFVEIEAKRISKTLASEAIWAIQARLNEGPDVPRRLVSGKISVLLGERQIGSIPYTAFIASKQ